VLSFERPTEHRYKGAYHVPIQLVRWLHRETIGYAMAADDDLHDQPELLDMYPALVLCWHSEYWSGEMRRNVETFIDRGGSLVSLSGNTCWWQTRIAETDDPVEPGSSRRLVCYKTRALRHDPYVDIDPGRVTTLWDSPPFNNPATDFLGLSWRQGGMVNSSRRSDCPCEFDWLEGHGGYTAYRTDHWIFEGTGAAEGDVIGREYAFVGYEVDGARIVWQDGRPIIDPEGGTPTDFEILGHAPCWNFYNTDGLGVGLMAVRESGRGFVFNGGTTGWCWGLAADPIVQRITRNLIDRAARYVPSSDSEIHLYPSPTRSQVTLELRGGEHPDRVDIYSASGQWITRTGVKRIGSRLSVATWDFTDRRGMRLPAGVYYLSVGRDMRRAVYVR